MTSRLNYVVAVCVLLLSTAANAISIPFSTGNSDYNLITADSFTTRAHTLLRYLTTIESAVEDQLTITINAGSAWLNSADEVVDGGPVKVIEPDGMMLLLMALVVLIIIRQWQRH